MSTQKTMGKATEIADLFAKQQAHQFLVGRSSVQERRRKLKRFASALWARRADIQQAVYKDLGKPPAEADLTEFYQVVNEIRYARARLADWMRPEKVKTPLAMTGARSFILYEPKGVVLIMSPWNFPINLSFCPLVSAIAAGNCVMIKPSEHSPHSSALMGEIIADVFPPEEVTLWQGGVEMAKRLLDLPFNHIFFTGSPAVGKKVMTAAAVHLSSVTLELGGKSPVIIDESADVSHAAKRILWAKGMNAGQICIAPDYVLVHEKVYEDFLKQCRKVYLALFGEDPATHPELGRLIHDRHWQHMKDLLDKALEEGGQVILGGTHDKKDRFFAPTLLGNIKPEFNIMQDEIFGPLLPIIRVAGKAEVVQIINEKERPLSLYIYSKKKKNIRYFLEHTRAGGGCINYNSMQFSNPNLPFGGINNSGIGKGHGEFGFKAFSNARGIMKQMGRFNMVSLINPPTTRLKQWLIEFTLRWL